MKKLETLPEEVQILVDSHYQDDDPAAIAQIRELGYIVETDGMGEILWIGVNETAEEIYRGLKYSTQFINMNWRIKVHAAGLNIAVGVSGLINMVGIDLANRLFDRAERGLGDKVVCKLRRGLKVTFYSK
jgi:hypothetical protein